MNRREFSKALGLVVIGAATFKPKLLPDVPVYALNDEQVIYIERPYPNKQVVTITYGRTGTIRRAKCICGQSGEMFRTTFPEPINVVAGDSIQFTWHWQ